MEILNSMFWSEHKNGYINKDSSKVHSKIEPLLFLKLNNTFKKNEKFLKHLAIK